MSQGEKILTVLMAIYCNREIAVVAVRKPDDHCKYFDPVGERNANEENPDTV